MGATLSTVYGAYTKFGRIFMGLANRLRKKNKPRHTNPDAGKQFHAASAAELDGLIGRTMDDFFAMAKVALNRAFGFGQKRWNRVHEKMLTDLACMADRLITSKEIDEGLCEEANFNFYRDTPRNRYDYAQKVAQTVIDDMSSVLCLALLDLYGFKAKRLKKMYDMIVFLGGELRRGAMTRAQLFAEADAIRKRATA